MSELEQNLKYLRKHPLFPFRGFQSDEAQYMNLELYWLYLFKSTIGGNRDAAWKAWQPPDPERKGNPIFSGINPNLKRAVRVIHHQMEEGQAHYSQGGDYFPFQAFLSHSPADPTEPEQEVLELCFLADVSEESERWCKEFWKLFCGDLASEAQLEERIRRYEEEVGMPGLEQEP